MTKKKQSPYANVRGDPVGGYFGTKRINGVSETAQGENALLCAQRLNQKCFNNGWAEPNPGVGRVATKMGRPKKKIASVEITESAKLEEDKGKTSHIESAFVRVARRSRGAHLSCVNSFIGFGKTDARNPDPSYSGFELFCFRSVIFRFYKEFVSKTRPKIKVQVLMI